MKDKQNVLVLSAGRRVELLQAFRSDAADRGLGLRVMAADANPKMSAACYMADEAFVLPRVEEDGYIEQLLTLCDDQDIGLVIPTIDTELLSLAQAKTEFVNYGVHIAVSDEEFINKCRDKRQTAQLFGSLDICTPKLLDRTQLTFPCFAKPYDGSRSIGATKLNQVADFTDTMKNDLNLIFMEYIDQTFAEYTVDLYFDRSGTLKCLVPRHRQEVRDGEISKGITRQNNVYQYLLERLMKLEGARGCLNLQLFADTEGQRYAALEINPRFGGGYPLSYAAGAKYSGWLIDEYILNKEVMFFDSWETDLQMLRYDAQVLTRHAN